MIIYAVAFIDRQVLAIAQEAIKAEMGLSDAQLGLLTGLAFSLFYVSVGIPIARYADKANRRNVLAVAASVWSIMTAVTAFAQNYVHLFLARIGVGVGEGGCNPPSYSIISDLYPEGQRGAALAFYTIGPNLGLLVGFLLGGVIVETHGWRVAFLAAAAPGLILAVLLRLTVREPIREKATNAAKKTAISFKDGMNFLVARVTLRWLAVAVSFGALVSYGAIAWTAPFLIRSFGISVSDVGIILAMAFGVGGAIGSFGSGYLADQLAKRSKRWYLLLPALINGAFIPFFAAGFLAPTASVAIALLAFPLAFGAMFAGVSLTVLNTIAPPDLRATASAMFLLVTNLFGVGLGAFAIGLLSDQLMPVYGAESLRLSLAIILPVAAFATAISFFVASRSVVDDLNSEPVPVSSL